MKRWWGVRHVRWYFARSRAMGRAMRNWQGIPLVPYDDERRLEAIWDGKDELTRGR